MSNSIKWNYKIMFPTDSNFINRVTNASFTQSKASGNPMIVLEMEVVSPTEVQVGNDTVNIAGVKTTNYYTTQSFVDGVLDVEKTAKNRSDLEKLYATFGLDFTEFNPENPDLSGFKGKSVYTQMSPEIQEQRKNPSAEQIADAKAKGVKFVQGDIMLNPITGKPLVSYRPNVREIFGLVA